MLTTPYEELSDSMRRYYCDAAQKVLKSRHVMARGKRWWRVPFVEAITPQWSQTSRNRSASGTSELHCVIDVSKLPPGTREVVVTIEDVP